MKRATITVLLLLIGAIVFRFITYPTNIDQAEIKEIYKVGDEQQKKLTTRM
jgi:hypothetical protein